VRGVRSSETLGSRNLHNRYPAEHQSSWHQFKDRINHQLGHIQVDMMAAPLR